MNMIQSAKDQVLALTTAAYQKAAAAGLLPEGVTVTPSVEIPKDTANGDYTTTFCLAAAKAMKMNPRQVAQILTEQMDLTDTYFTSVELAGPGFLNFRLGSRWFGDTVACVEAEGADYGRILVGVQVPAVDERGFRSFLETLAYPYVEESANPVYRLFLR